MSAVAEQEIVHHESQIRPNPFAVNKPSFKVQDYVLNGDERHLFTYEFKRLDSNNFKLLLDKEKDTKRITETLTKSRTRDRFNADEANANFFDATIIQGWHQIVGDDEVDTLTYAELKEFTVERKTAANSRYLQSKAKVREIIGSGKLDFMFERPGFMMVELSIGDFDDPTFKLLLKTRRPKHGKRSKFREDFAYEVVQRNTDLPVSSTVVDIRGGVNLLNEYFDCVIMDDNQYSEVVFLQEDGKTLDHKYDPESPEDRQAFLNMINPQFKVEVAGGMVATFSKSDSDR